jgi:DNA-binding IclR family transcriptional regulator
VFDDGGECVAAVSIPFLETADADVVNRFHAGLRTAAESITRRLGGGVDHRG